MADWSGKRYWLIGASDGLGAALARAMVAQGAQVVLSARSEAGLNALVADLGAQATALPMDVSDDRSVAQAFARAGRVDGVVFLAGVYWPMSARSWNAEQAIAMVDVNLTGLVRVLGHVVPQMVARDQGHIVIAASLSAYRGLPGSIGYTASKAGVLSIAECIYADLRRTGVRVQVVNPGFVKTRLTAKNDFAMPFLMTPPEAAGRMLAHMGRRRFKTAFPRTFAGIVRAAQILPDWLYFRLFS